MLLYNQSNVNVSGFNFNGQIYNIPSQASLEVDGEVGIRLLQTFGFLVESKEGVNLMTDTIGEFPDNFFQLKALARAKGIEVTKEMKKEQVLEALSNL